MAPEINLESRRLAAVSGGRHGLLVVSTRRYFPADIMCIVCLLCCVPVVTGVAIRVRVTGEEMPSSHSCAVASL
jgi:hypothetical protein